MREVVLLSLVTAWLVFTLSESKLLAPVRSWVGRRSSWLGDLLSCGYCTGFWVALGVVALYRPRLFALWAPLDYVLTVLVVAWLAAVQWAVLCALMKWTGK